MQDRGPEPEGDAQANLQFLRATIRVLRARGMTYDEILLAVARIAEAEAH
jgi:hypothetical protein